MTAEARRNIARRPLNQVQLRQDQLRKARTNAQKLRDVHPDTALVEVQLEFLSAAEPRHTSQSFTLYPPARLHFSYPCPFGDCSGVYELDAPAGQTLRREKKKVTGTLDCEGTRTAEGTGKRSCGLRVSYTIVAHHEPSTR
jgi:hypothetical protein